MCLGKSGDYTAFMIHRCQVIACLLGVITGMAHAALAQDAVSAALLVGTVQGPDGARLPGVVITLTTAGREVSQIVSGDQGVFRVSGLKPGRYQVRAEIQGFRTVAQDIDAADDEVVSLTLSLALESLVETVTVVGTADRETLEAPRVRESSARDVGEALAGVAGVWKVRRGAIGSDIVVRGYQGDSVTVLIDGARLYGACPNNMDPTAFHVDLAEVDRIEIG
jgi:hypothetical protein